MLIVYCILITTQNSLLIKTVSNGEIAKNTNNAAVSLSHNNIWQLFKNTTKPDPSEVPKKHSNLLACFLQMRTFLT